MKRISERVSGKKFFHRVASQDGVALVMVLLLSLILLAIMASLLYMLTASTQVSGIQKRYKTALEAGRGGVDAAILFIGKRGNFEFDRNQIWSTITMSSTCASNKLNNSTKDWNASCSQSLWIDPTGTDTTSYDFALELGTTAVYRIYGKIVDTVEGNSAADTGLLGRGVVSSASEGEVTVQSMPYLYTVEVDATNKDNPQEHARYSILYQY